jgi:hypothetical protein
MNARHVTRVLAGVALLIAVGPAAAAAQDEWQATTTLVDVVRRATERFRDADEALLAGYTQMPSCVSGPEAGAMGVHFVNRPLVPDGQLDAERPEALVYEPKDGRLRLVGVEYIVLADAWHATHQGPPVLMGQHFHLVPSPNRYGNPPFYELHVWAWRQNPNGMFVDWNPRVSCEHHSPEGSNR